MEISQGLFPRLLVGTFAVAVLAFFVRGFGQLVFGSSTARILAAPLFGVGILMAVMAFILSVLVVFGPLGRESDP